MAREGGVLTHLMRIPDLDTLVWRPYMIPEGLVRRVGLHPE